MTEDTPMKNYRPRITYALKNRVMALATELADDDRTIRGFYDALVVVVEHVEDQNNDRSR